MALFTLAEPLPTTLPNHYTYTGRGGAGNMYKPSASPPTAPSPLLRKSTTSASTTSTSSTFSTSSTSSASSASSTSSAKFHAGRGGAGNVRARADAAPFSFADELSLQTTREQRRAGAVCHVGRGGAGNCAAGAAEGGGGLERRRAGSKGSGGLLGRIGGFFEGRG